jgi:hypothetical protein
MNDRLDDRITEFYQAQSLSPERLNALRLLAERHAADRKKQARFRRLPSFRQTVALGFATAVLFLTIGLAVQWKDRRFSARGLPQAVASEIAMNHRKQLALEFSASDYGDLRHQMDKLDFQLVAPADAEAAHLHLLGARYCSVQGRLAAQIRLRDDAGHVHTLYETESSEKLRAAVSSHLSADGVRVRTWTDKGIFYGLAVTESDSHQGTSAPDQSTSH